MTMGVNLHVSSWVWSCRRKVVLLRNFTVAGALLLSVGLGSAFNPFPLPDRRPSFTGGRLQSTKSNQEVKTVVNGEESGEGGLLRMQDTKSQLFAAFTTLGVADQYDAVLTGLCAKILENTSLSSQEVQDALQDPLQLIEEMNRRRIRASPRSLMALIDSTVRTQSPSTMAKVLELSKKNGGVNSYGSLVPDVLPLPSNPLNKVRDTGSTCSERLSKIDLPSDERESETAAALAVLATLGGCLLVDVVHLDDVATYTNLLLSAMVVGGLVDNFYDVLTSLVSIASKDKPVNLPKKADLPLGLGSGQVSGNVIRGLTRLSTVDAEREAQCEASALLVAYTLGLPCFAFRPNALEGSVLMIESAQKDAGAASLITPTGIVRMLVWLLAPVAMENSRYSQLICSDPREASGLLRRLELYYENKPEALPWESESERENILKWAYAETDLLLRENKKLVDELSACLTSGAGTIGDCIAILERW